jgi:surfactin synthase thioesterase subunit
MSCPLLALQGADDPVFSPHSARAWREQTSGRSSITWRPGGHFFHTDPEFLRTALRPLVARMLAQ